MHRRTMHHLEMDHPSAFQQHLRNHGAAEDTIRRRMGTIRAWQRFRHPGGLDDATLDDVEAFIGQWKSNSTKRAYLGDLRAFYRWGRTRGLPNDPTAGFGRIRVAKRLPRPLTHDEWVMAVTMAHDDRVKTALLLATQAGLRRRDIVRLHTDDVHLDGPHPMLIVRGSKGEKDRALPLNPFLRDWLRIVTPKSGYLFPGRRLGEHLSADRLNVIVGEHLRALGIEGNVHRGRHTFGTNFAFTAKGNMLATAEAMGHSSMDQARQYSAMVGVNLREFIDAMPTPTVAGVVA